MNNPYHTPNQENDILLKAIATCLNEDGHTTHIEGTGSTAAIIVTKHNPNPEMQGAPLETWTITTENGHAHIATNNIGILDTEEAELAQHIHHIELANPNCFQQITNHIKNTTPE